MEGMNNSVETVNAAATAIVSAETRVQQVTVERRRWGGCFGAYWCFKPQRQSKRVSHAVLVPEPILPGSEAPAPTNQTNSSALVLPFIAPPSSPVSFLQSEPPSATLSPAGPLSLSALSVNAYSPTGPAFIFTIGPYAHEPQLVSPPVFSTFTTEPSTASFTPPEPLHLTTPSSPEVPFARLLTSSLNANCNKGVSYDFNSYQFYPGSPIGHLISPSSACSGTSSPFPDLEYLSSGGIRLPTFPAGEPPKILSGEGLVARKLTPIHAAARDGPSRLDGQIAAVSPKLDSATKSQNDEADATHRVSFELSAEEVARCIAKKPPLSGEVLEPRLVETAKSATSNGDAADDNSCSSRLCVDETYHDLPLTPQSSAAVQAVKEFKFDNADGASLEPVVGSDWWANEKVAGTDAGRHKKWTMFPMIQPGVS